MNDRKCDVHPAALIELWEARQWYAERSPRAADRFFQQYEQALEMIAARPLTWPNYHRGTRHYLLQSFPYHVIYRLSGDAVQVLAVAHAKRRPGYWQDRIA